MPLENGGEKKYSSIQQEFVLGKEDETDCTFECW